MNYFHRWFLLFIAVCFAVAPTKIAHAQSQPSAAEQLFALANQSRAQAGLQPLQWDGALAAAAMKHCQRMVAAGALSHRYPGELDLTERAAQSGAHFGLIEENIAMGQYPDQVHSGWMQSPGHRENLLNRDIDHVGIAVILRGGYLYAVADYSQGVASLTPDRAEAQVGRLVRMTGISLRGDNRDARRACVLDHGLPEKLSGAGTPAFVMRWQNADLEHLPQGLVDRLGSGRYQQAAVGNCPPNDGGSGFTMYRFAVLLY